jgi:hypothetical protein
MGARTTLLKKYPDVNARADHRISNLAGLYTKSRPRRIAVIRRL